MTIVQKFEYTWPEGSPQLAFESWIATLTQAEQDEFAQAKDRQQALRQQWIDNGLLSLIPDGYEWKDRDTYNTGKPMDPVWQTYWARWMLATGVQVSYPTTEV